MHVAFGVPGAPLTDILTPQSWGGQAEPSLSRCYGGRNQWDLGVPKQEVAS